MLLVASCVRQYSLYWYVHLCRSLQTVLDNTVCTGTLMLLVTSCVRQYGLYWYTYNVSHKLC